MRHLLFFVFFTESFSVIAVNVFVLLTGWYGIKPRTSRLIEFLFQVLFFGIICMCCEWFLTGSKPPRIFHTIFALTPTYWFVKAYLALYIISPVLNTFVEHSPRQQFKYVLIAFFAFQSLFSWVFKGAVWIEFGYSLPSFAGLYLLARYIRIYKPTFTQFHLKTDFLFYICFVLFNTIMALVFLQIGRESWFFVYTSPFVIVEAVYFLLFFSKLSLKSNIINWVAISAFSIYLTHTNEYLGKYYINIIFKWFNECSTVSFVANVTVLIVGVFISSVLVDKVRIFLWNCFKDTYLAVKSLPEGQ